MIRPDRDELRVRQRSRLLEMRRKNERQKAATNGRSGGCRLRVVSFNTGLLSAPIASVPFVPGRGAELPKALLQLNADIILLQEVWNIRYKRALDAGMPQYKAFYVPKGHRGLVILVRRSLISNGGGDAKLEELIYRPQRTIEYFIYHKAALALEIQLDGFEAPVHVVNFHLVGGNANRIQRIRLAQVEQLSEKLLQPRIDTGRGHLIVGGDLNSTVFYKQDTYSVGGKTTHGWRKTVDIYNMLVEKADLLDSYAALHGDHEIDAADNPGNGHIPWATQDQNNSLAPLTNPMRYEPSQRVDFVFVRPLGSSNHAIVEAAELALRERFIPFNGEAIELSDHYAYATEMMLY